MEDDLRHYEAMVANMAAAMPGIPGIPGAYAEEEFSESEDEGTDAYRRGGYHIVNPGEVYNKRYTVVAKLGWGHFSTVWLCQDLQQKRFVAMKVQKSAPNYTDAAYDEIELLMHIAKKEKSSDWEATTQGPFRDTFPEHPFTGVVQLIDYFEHSGPNGRHVCMVFETMGPNILALIKRYKFKGVPLYIVRKVAMHTLVGLDYLHRVCGIIHTDLKPENILVTCPEGVPVNKYGIPLIGEVDKALKVAKEKQTPAERLFRVREQDRVSTKSDKKGKKGKKDASGKAGYSDESLMSGGPPSGPPPPAVTPWQAKGLSEPPYMKPYLKPNRSDPTMLSSYGDSESMLMKPPYHWHRQRVPDAEGQKDGKSDGEPQMPDAQRIQSTDIAKDQELLDKVARLDLFSHEKVIYKIADLGNACWVTKHFSDDIQTRQYRGPETIINAGYDTSADIWSFACMIFELVTGDYLFDPKASEEYPRDEDHLALFQELLGEVPKALVFRGKRAMTFFNRRGELRHIKKLKPWPLDSVLVSKYHMHTLEAVNLASFLGAMLRLMPEERDTAYKLLGHPWLRGLPSPEVTQMVNSLGVPGSLVPAAPAAPEEEAEAQRLKAAAAMTMQ
eukprot:TRINITY_DN15361_c0_g1_i1.p1 TRINITY_DN15361_c0_g1~~TRINITY_DN15361_c0_g1_i1.p1  ORF type:complete len:614 (-),score=163.38 TRINITY_DN15361_c0_g1_i1:448-2289(-)